MAVIRRFAWVLAFFGALVLGVFLVYSLWVDKIETPWAVAGGFGAALIGVWLWSDWTDISGSFKSRGTMHNVAASVLVVMALGVAIAINVLGSRYDKRWDLTSGHNFSLSDQTVSVLEGLDEEVKVLAFFALGTPEGDQFKTLVEGYEEHTDKLVVSWHDPFGDPILVKEYDITHDYGTVIVQVGDSRKRLSSTFDEEALTNAIINATSKTQHVICSVEGHGERDVDDDNTAEGIGAAILKLEALNYTVKKVRLAAEGKVPEDCEVLLAAAPESDWFPAERELVAAYVAGGGSFLLTLEPESAPQLAADMTRFGIKVGDDVVVEANPNNQVMGVGPTFVILYGDSFDHHAVTTPLATATIIMDYVRSVSTADALDGVRVQTLATASEASWGETSKTELNPDPGVDLISKVPVMAVAEVDDPSAIVVRAVERLGSDVPLTAPVPEATEGSAGDGSGEAAPANGEAPQAETPEAVAESAAPTPSPAPGAELDVPRKAGGKVMIIGDTSFATNQLVDQFHNVDLLLNTLAWMVGEDDQVSIRANKVAQGTMSMSFLQGFLSWTLLLVVVPGLSIAGALGTWKHRRGL